MNTHHTQYKMGIIKYNLLEAFKNTGDAPSFVYILHLIYKLSVDEKNLVSQYNVDNKYLAQQFVESCILEAIDSIFPRNKYLYLMVVFTYLQLNAVQTFSFTYIKN